MGEQFENPPVTEAICEVNFSEISNWNQTFPGKIHSKIEDIFPQVQDHKKVSVDLHQDPENIEQISKEVRTETTAQFTSDNEQFLCMVEPKSMTIHHLKPYTSWDQFIEKIRASFAAFFDLVGPQAIESVLVRYINIFEITDKVSIDEYFNFRPFLTDDITNGRPVNSFITGVKLPAEESGELTIKINSQEYSDDPNEIILDLSCERFEISDCVLDQVMDWATYAHDEEIEPAFLNCLTSNLINELKG